jgi:GntR family transcriptional regulator, transcriptional repressor for pyruvate dehydrogenase complex
VLKLQRPKTSDLLVSQIREFITGQGLKPGDPLPTENALAERFGVSRISVREATKTLGFLGVLDAKPGRGLTVGRVDVGRLKESLSLHPAMYDVPVDELIDTRAIIETGVVPHVARRMAADPEIYERLNRLNDELRHTRSSSNHTALDAQFHQLLVESSGLTPLAAFNDLLQVFVVRCCKFMQKNWRGTADRHQKILDAMRNGKMATATKLLQHHIEAHKQGAH